MDGALKGRRIVVPETRELDLLARMIEAEGGEVVRCPLVAIVEAPDPEPILSWLRRFRDDPGDDLILLTGEGLRRLDGVARDAGEEAGFLRSLAAVRTITRGPKPAKALRELGLEPRLRAPEPTTEGVIAALADENLAGRRVGVQLYPDNPNTRLLGFLTGAGAKPDPVVPYAYAAQAAEARVIEIIEIMAAGGAHAVAFTSSPQVRRLFDVAKKTGRDGQLRAGLARVEVAAIGSVTAAELRAHGASVAIEPRDASFMKPLVRAIATALAAQAGYPGDKLE